MHCTLCMYRIAASAAQSDINDKMRAILVDWLVEVHLKFKVLSGSRMPPASHTPARTASSLLDRVC